MSTSNFTFMKYGMPLIVIAPEIEMQGFGKTKEEYEKEFDEEYTENMYNSDLQFDYDLLYEEMNTLAKHFNDSLHYYEVNVESGYYSGLQFIVNTYEDLDYDKNSPYCIDNEDAHYYFDECKSKILRRAESERKRIYKWLKSLKNQGYIELSCDGVFSNGEAVYSIVK